LDVLRFKVFPLSFIFCDAGQCFQR
jgi:hypothetical protein